MKVNNRGENVILEMVKPLKNKGYEFPRTHTSCVVSETQ